MIYIAVRLRGKLEEEMERRAGVGRSKAEICRQALAVLFDLEERGADEHE